MTKSWARLRGVVSNNKVRRKAVTHQHDTITAHDDVPVISKTTFQQPQQQPQQQYQQHVLSHSPASIQVTGSTLSELDMISLQKMLCGDISPVPTYLSGSTAYTLSDSMTELDTPYVRRDTLALPVHCIDYNQISLSSEATQEFCLTSMGSGFIDTENNKKSETAFQGQVEPKLTCDGYIRPHSKCWPAEPSENNTQTNSDMLKPFPSAKSLFSSCHTDSLLSDDVSEDLNWLIDLHNVCGILGSKHPFVLVESEGIEDVVRAYQGQTISEEESTGSSKPSTTTSGVGSDTPKVAGKRPFEGDEPAAEDSEGPAIKSRRKQVCPGEARLSCPFQKRDPERYPLCGIRQSGYLTIGHVKQHLRRSHRRNPNYCPRCKTTFSTEAQKNDHIMQAFVVPCQEQASALPEGISPEMEDALTRRVEQGSSLHDQWFSIWDMIFPGIPRPASCTFDLSGETHIQVLGLASYLESEGPAIVQSTLERHGLVVFLANPEHIESLPADVELYTRGVLSQAFRQLYESWQAQRPRLGSADSSGHFIMTPTTGSSLQEGQNLPPTPISSSGHGEYVSQIPMSGHEPPDRPLVEGGSSAVSRMLVEAGQGDSLQELPPLTDSDEGMMWLAYVDSSASTTV